MRHFLFTFAAVVVLTAAAAAAIAQSASPPSAPPGVGGGGGGPRRVLEYPSAAVASDHAIVSAAALEMLQKGGNAVDAAVAASFTLSVVRPYSCGIGGGGFMLIYLPATDSRPEVRTSICYRERAPAGITPDYFAKLDDPDASTVGGAAVGVPGTVAGLLFALENFGTLDRATVLAPAIRVAERGFAADEDYVRMVRGRTRWFAADPSRTDKFPMVWERLIRGGKIQRGDRVFLPDQSNAFRAIVHDGRDGFYTGPVAKAICDSVAVCGGLLTLEDLAAYQPTQDAPLESDFRGRRILTMPPPSSGGIAIQQVLSVIESRDAEISSLTPASPIYLHVLAEAFKHAYADRARFLADPLFAEVPVSRLLDPQALRARAAAISPDRVLDHNAYGSSVPSDAAPHATPPDDSGTSHISVVDPFGGAVACTETTNTSFGSQVGVDGFGFILNNQMDDFTRPGIANAFQLTQADANLPEPSKRPLSSMSPTIVLEAVPPANASVDPASPSADTKPAANAASSSWRVAMVVGASGGPRIISATLQVMINVLVFSMPVQDAVDAARIHHQWSPNILRVQGSLLSDTLRADLAARGHDVQPESDAAVVQAVVRGESGWFAASDARKAKSTAAGY